MRMCKKHIRSVVERLLTSNRVSSAPVPIEDVARALGKPPTLSKDDIVIDENEKHQRLT